MGMPDSSTLNALNRLFREGGRVAGLGRNGCGRYGSRSGCCHRCWVITVSASSGCLGGSSGHDMDWSHESSPTFCRDIDTHYTHRTAVMVMMMMMMMMMWGLRSSDVGLT